MVKLKLVIRFQSKNRKGKLIMANNMNVLLETSKNRIKINRITANRNCKGYIMYKKID